MQFRISSIEGNHQKLDGGAMFGNAPKAIWSQWAPVDELNRIELACRSLLIETPEHKILCETGIGAFFEPKLAQRYGVQNNDEHLLLNNLNLLGINHTDIDYVILSHLHFDHAGGLLPKYTDILNGKNELLFPNAKILIGKEAYERCINPHPRDKASFIPLLSSLLKDSDRVILINGSTAPGIYEENLSFKYSNGHTPGQMHTLFKGTENSVFFCGDLIPGCSWLHIPITMGYDRYPELLIDEKKNIYSEAIPSKWWMFYTHDSQYCVSKCSYDDRGRVVPTEAQDKIVQMIL